MEASELDPAALFDLSGNRALVTGCRRGIGLAMAEALARAGADVVGASAQLEATGSEVERRVHAAGREFSGYQVDFADRAAVEQFVAEVTGGDRAIDILVNNAGTIARAPAVDHDTATWERILEINLTVPFLLARGIGAGMVARGAGKLIFTASLLSFQGGIMVPSYTASKSGLSGLIRALSTDNTEALRNDPDRSRAILERIPAGRWGAAGDLAGATVFLASPASDYVCGTILAVDGGWLAR